MCNAAQHEGWSKQHKDKSRASSSRLTRLSFLADMTLTMWHDWRDIGCQDLPIILQKNGLAGIERITPISFKATFPKNFSSKTFESES